MMFYAYYLKSDSIPAKRCSLNSIALMRRLWKTARLQAKACWHFEGLTGTWSVNPPLERLDGGDGSQLIRVN